MNPKSSAQFWRIVAVIYCVLFSFAIAATVWAAINHPGSLRKTLNPVFWFGVLPLIGLGWRRRFFNIWLWRGYFALVLLLVLAQLVPVFSGAVGSQHLPQVLLFVVGLRLPLLLGAFLYAFKSPNIWALPPNNQFQRTDSPSARLPLN